MQNKTRRAIRRGRTGGGVEPMESRTLLAAASFGGGEFHLHDLSTSAEVAQRSSGLNSFTNRSMGDRKAESDGAALPGQHFGAPVSPFDWDRSRESNSKTFAVVPAADASSQVDPEGADQLIPSPSGDRNHDNGNGNGWRNRDSGKSDSDSFGWAVVIDTPGMILIFPAPQFGDSFRGHGSGFGQRGNRNAGRDNNESSLPRQNNSQTSARPGQTIVDAAADANPSVAAPAASEALQRASAAVAKSIFSSDPIVPHAATYGTAAAMAPVAATPSADPAGRSILLYLSTMTAGAEPILAAAKVAAVQAVGENVVHAAEAGTELAMASAATILPSPHRAAEIVRMGSPMMLVADSIGAFIEESVNMASIVTRQTPQNRHRAWLVTGAVVAADAVLLTYCFYRRRQLRLVEAVVARRIQR